MSSRVLTYAHLVEVAERLFHRTGGLDMDELARAACVSRATLYRVAGSRDRVLGDVLWAQGSRLLTRLLADTDGSGADRLVAVSQAFKRELLTYAPLRRLRHDDPATAFRVLMTAEPGVHTRFVALWREVIEQAQQVGELSAGLAAADIAAVFVRLGESVLYSDLLGDSEPDLALAARVQRALLQAG